MFIISYSIFCIKSSFKDKYATCTLCCGELHIVRGHMTMSPQLKETNITSNVSVSKIMIHYENLLYFGTIADQHKDWNTDRQIQKRSGVFRLKTRQKPESTRVLSCQNQFTLFHFYCFIDAKKILCIFSDIYIVLD